MRRGRRNQTRKRQPLLPHLFAQLVHLCPGDALREVGGVLDADALRVVEVALLGKVLDRLDPLGTKMVLARAVLAAAVDGLATAFTLATYRWAAAGPKPTSEAILIYGWGNRLGETWIMIYITPVHSPTSRPRSVD